MYSERPIIVYFDNIYDMNSFIGYPGFDKFKDQTNTLTEEHDSFTRDQRIQRATCRSQITLMTTSFGRGTDFILNDKQVI